MTVLGRLLIAVAIAAAILPAQRLPIQVYTTTDGLAQSTVHKIFRDSRGFLWFGTSEGISRYDGYDFKSYVEPGRSKQRRIRELIEADDGTFWVGTDDGVCLFRPAPNEPESSKPVFECAKPAGVTQARVQVLYAPRRGELLAGMEAGLYRVRTTGNVLEFEQIDLDPAAGDRLGIWAIRRDRSGAVWIGATRGLYRLLTGQPTWRFTSRNGLPSDEVQALEFDPEGRLWAGTKEGVALIRRQPVPGSTVVERVYSMQDGLPAVGVKVLHFWKDAIWVGTTGGIAEAIRSSTGATDGFRPYTSRNGLSHLDIDTMAEDIAGNLWIGAQSGGAMKMTRYGFVTYGTADGLASPYVMAMLETRSGQICAMTRVPGQLQLNILDGERFRSAPVPVSSSFYSSRWSGWHQVARDTPDGRWWIGSERGLLQFQQGWWSGRQGPSRVFTHHDGLTGDHIYQVFEDSKGGIWVVSRMDSNGLARRDPQTGEFRRFTPSDGLPSLEEGRPNGFGEDQHGQVWIGWWRTGVLRYSDGRFQFFGAADGVPPGGIRRVLTDRHGRVWLGSGGGGVARVDNPKSSKPAFRTYGLAEGLSAAEIQALAEDKRGRIYAGTGHGVDRFDPDAAGPLRVRHFTTRDGLAGGELQTAFRDRNDTLWFGSVQGVSRLIPEPDEPVRASAVYITGVRVNGHSATIPNGAQASFAIPVSFGTRDQLEIEFVSPRFAPGEAISYQYRLSANREWSAPTRARSVQFGGVQDGAHRFEVRSISDDGEVSAASAALTFQVIAPFWLRWWFLLLCFATVAGAVYGLHRYDLQRRLELESVRTRIARDLHDQVGSGLSQIAILSEVARRLPGKESNAQIAEVSRELVDALGDIVWAINPARDNLPDLTQRMRRFAADLFTAGDVALDFQAEGIDPAAVIGPEVRRQVYLIFRECLHNITRHSQCSRVRIRIAHENGELLLVVEDNGIGFDRNTATRGNGLPSLRERCRTLGGQITWESEHGTRVTLRLPLSV